ncbi:MAG: DNRLRE domain-containing protein [Spirochaetales bacterium]|nr:DNRLRE domain-containing protein [Spirochaetales bacterium]
MSDGIKRSWIPEAGRMLLLVSVILAVFSGCQDPMFQSGENKDGSGRYVDEETGDVFVNGLNTTYMEANNMTEADLLAMIKASNETDAASPGTRAAADDTDLFDIMTHFTDYFTIKLRQYKDINGKTTSVALQVGLDTALLETPLHDLRRVIKDTRYNWQEISNFSIEKIDNRFLYLKGRLHVKSWTALPFNGRLKIADKEADIKVRVEFLFDEEVNGVGYCYEVTDVSIDREWTDIFFCALAIIHPGFGITPLIINEIHRNIVKGKILKDGRGYYYVELGNYIDPEYFVIKPVTSSGSWIYFNFEATYKGVDLIETLALLIKIQRQTKVEHYIYLYKKVYPSADAMISNAVNNGVDYSDRNYGSYQYFQAGSWTYQGKQGDNRSLMMFPDSAFPLSLESARLYLFGIDHDPLTQSNACYLQRVTSSWTEPGVTWDNQPDVSESVQISIPQLTSPTANISIDITAWAKRWSRRNIPFLGWKNYGMMLRLQNEKYYARMQFGSREYSTAGKRPYLLVRYYTVTTTE